jgi:tetratricopeptide (TPR) repeat protein
MSHKWAFISHSSKDDEIVAEIRETLELLGIEVWADSQRLSGGDKLPSDILGAIGDSTHFVAILSVSAINSAWVAKEIQHALRVQERRGDSYKLIPMLLPSIEPIAVRSWFPQDTVAVRLSGGPGGVIEAMPELLAALGEQLPDEAAPSLQVQVPPIADLVLRLTDPSIYAVEEKRNATATATLTYYPPDGSREVESKRYKFTAPLGPVEAGELAWYLERYVNWPSGVFQERASRVEEAFPHWGRVLYDTLNASATRSALDAWTAAPPQVERRFTVKVDKELMGGGPPDERQREADEAATLLLSLPWELIHDEDGFLFQGARGVRVRRSLPNRVPQNAITTRAPIRVLLLSPRPEDKSVGYIDHRLSARPLVEALSRLGPLAEFTVLTPPTFQALQLELQRATDADRPYHVVHFDGHGAYNLKHGLGALIFEDPSDSGKIEERRSIPVTANMIAEVIRGHRTPLFFLEACRSAQATADPTASVAGKLLECGVASVVAMSHSVLAETTRRFVSIFYPELLAGRRVGQAMLAGQRSLKMDPFRGKVFTGDLHLQDWFVPVLFQEEQDTPIIRKGPARQVQSLIARQRELAFGRVSPEPRHGFIGRSRELLKAERLLARERYAVLKGGEGEGKTTLAAELARWLVVTRRFRSSVWVGVDEDGDARKIAYAIGEQLVPNYLTRAGQSDKLAHQLVERALAQQPRVIVLDNMESVLEPAEGSKARLTFEPEVLGDILELLSTLGKVGATRMIFTSREALPEPFSRNVVEVGRLDWKDAIRLVSRVLGEDNLVPHAADSGESEEEIQNLVEAAGCHARTLALISGEVVASGVRHATGKLNELLVSLEAKHPGDRERSPLASVQLSLRRLPEKTRRQIHPLAVFQGGGSALAICAAMGLELQQFISLVHKLEGVGLAKYAEIGYLRLDPTLSTALAEEMSPEERESALAGWAEATSRMAFHLARQESTATELVRKLTLLEMPNLIAALEYLYKRGAPEVIVVLASRLESLIAPLGRPKALAHVAAIRTKANDHCGEWNPATFNAEVSAVYRLSDKGQAVETARSLLEKVRTVSESAKEGAALAVLNAYCAFGRTLQMSGYVEEAITYLDEAIKRAEGLGLTEWSYMVLADKGDCLMELGRIEKAAKVYEESIRKAEKSGDLRGVAVGKGQLASVRMVQRRYDEALDLHNDLRERFERLEEPLQVATAWQLIGVTYEGLDQHDAAERAFQMSLGISVRLGDRSIEEKTLAELGYLYLKQGRFEEAARFCRNAAETAKSQNDLFAEGLDRINLAALLLELKRYDEARAELTRCEECLKPFGLAGKPWSYFHLVSVLEWAMGNEPAARNARSQAIQAYLDYRRAGGDSQTDARRLCEFALQAEVIGVEWLAEASQLSNVSDSMKALRSSLEVVLRGSRDVALADDPNLNFEEAAELLLLIESLA